MKKKFNLISSAIANAGIKFPVAFLIFVAVIIQLYGCGVSGSNAVVDSAVKSETGHCVSSSEYLHPGGSGTGGTGYDPDSGAGGTGNMADRGFGGTGIVGVITGFGSICVNGERIVFDNKTSFKIDGVDTSIEEVRKGQFASVYAINSSDGLLAKEVSITHALEGPVSDIQVDSNMLFVLGVWVKWNNNTIFVHEGKGAVLPSDLQEDDNLSVSGYWVSPDLVIATRIDKLIENAHVGASGLINQMVEDRFMINKLPVRMKNPGLIESTAVGTTAYVSGYWNGTEIEADLVEINLPTPYSDRAEILNLEGYVNKVINKDKFVMLGSVQVTVNTDTQILETDLALIAGKRIRVLGTVNNQKQLYARHIRIVQ